MHIGVIGARGLGADFVKLFHLHPDVDRVTVADGDPAMRARAQERHPGIATVPGMDELLDHRPDAVAVFTPPWCHAEMTLGALAAGAHVLCACPMGLTLDELRAVESAVARSGLIYMTAETSYYYKGAMWSRRAWAEGRFGELVYAEGEYYYRPHAYDFWLRPRYGTMPPMLYPTHSTTMVLSVTGQRFERVACLGMPGLHPDVSGLEPRPEWAHNRTSNMTLLARLSGGAAARINEMRNVGCKGELGSLVGTAGSIRQHQGMAVWSDGLREEVDLSALWRDPAHHPQTEAASRLPTSYAGHGMGHDGSHRFLADEFVRALRDDRRPHNDLVQAFDACAPGIVAWDSCQRDGDWLPVPAAAEPVDGRRPLEW